MQTLYLEALLIPIASGVSLRLMDEAKAPLEQSFTVELPRDCRAAGSERCMKAAKPGDRPPFIYDATAPERGLNALRIFELRDYGWQLEFGNAANPPQVKITSSLTQSDAGGRWRAFERYGRFCFESYLGAAWIDIKVGDLPPVKISFEVTSPKLDYERDYRSMVEAIGEQCQQLLLEWSTPTTLNLSSDPAKRAQTLLEQFMFLRHTLGPDRLELYLEIIQRRPHTRLEREQDWKPTGAANPVLFVRDPLRYGRGWHRQATVIIPEEVREERKFDSLDTPPNQFLKFALQSFRSLCDDVLKAQRSGKPAWKDGSPVILEAHAMQQTLDAFLALPLFDDVDELRRVPFESISLQRREGYREILHGWLMLDAASQIDWPGHSDAYKGASRNVATLYEYWLYFLLVRAFRDKLEMMPADGPLEKAHGVLPFCCLAKDGRLLINLKQGEESICCFRWQLGKQKLRVHFFYNRVFSEGKGVGERGSYSRRFRPDFTLALIPEEFDGGDWHAAEEAAEKAGRIAYLHLDAKYRGENLIGLFGAADAEDEDEDPEVISSAKKSDLCKMHTYNDAIRRTVGSYVLYPGTASKPEDANKRFERYNEIVSGIGAFALRPNRENAQPEGLPCLLKFVLDLLTHHLTQFSQSYRIDYWTESSVREGRVDNPVGPIGLKLGPRPPKDTQILPGHVRCEDAALDCRNTKAYFCDAAEWKPNDSGELDEATDLLFDPFRPEFFVAYYCRQTAGWVAKVKEVKQVNG